MKSFNIICLCVMLFIGLSCSNNESKSNIVTSKNASKAKGKLFIIGGGKRPPTLIKELLKVSSLSDNDYIVILPMASQEPDSAIFYSRKQFLDLGIPQDKVIGYNFKKDIINKKWVDSLFNAKLIYISGGDQEKFMNIVHNTSIEFAIKQAYKKGSTISGTSAGAAVMSKYMITGNQYKHKDYSVGFRTIESNNIELSEGLGLLENVIIDQHFIKRMRLNRLISVAIENLNKTAIGIDESTALIIEGDNARVYGDSQVVILKGNSAKIKVQNGLLGVDDMSLSIKLPNSKFKLNN